MLPTSTLVVILGLSLLLRALFAGYETGLQSVDRIRIRHMAEEENHARARRLLRYLDREGSLFIALLLGGNIALIAAGLALVGLSGAVWLPLTVAAFPIIVLVDIIPRSIFRQRPMRLVLTLLPLVQGLQYLLFVVVVPLSWLLGALRWMAGVPRAFVSRTTEEDFLHLVDDSAAAGNIEQDEREMIHSVLDLQSTQAKEVMVPRTEIQALADTANRAELIALFMESGRTRIPIFHESIDRILGVANVYDVLLDDDPDNESIGRFAKEVIHVPDSIPVDDLLQRLKSSKQHMAIVTDEYGGTDGLVTLEDTLEEIFGEIHDEHDQPFEMIRRVSPRAFVIDARAPLEEVTQAIGVSVEDEEVETIGGWVMRAAGRIPDQGEKVKHAGFRITVLEGRRNQITKIRLEILKDHPALAGPSSNDEPEG